MPRGNTGHSMCINDIRKMIPILSLVVIIFCAALIINPNFIQNQSHFYHYTSRWNSSKHITIDDVLITIKTTQDNIATRVTLQLRTWAKRVVNQTYFITDNMSNEETETKLQGHVINTSCQSGRGLLFRRWLCCKTGEEFQNYLNKGRRKWWCHFDDDVYVNVEGLLNFLHGFDPDREYIYAGQVVRKFQVSRTFNNTEVWFRHITGAAYCISRALNKLIEPWLTGGHKMIETCGLAQSPDDVAIGFLINGVLKVNLTDSNLFHSHIGRLGHLLKNVDLLKQVTLSYKSSNTIDFQENLKPIFNETEDPTRMMSLHCMIQPKDEICNKEQ